MAAISNIDLRLERTFINPKKQNMSKSANNVKLSVYRSGNNATWNNKRRSSISSLISAYSDSTNPRVERGNGNNGIRIHECETSLTEGELENDSAVQTALVMRGRFVEGSFVYRQIFAIRCSEVGPNNTVTMESLMNFLLETAQNHLSGIGGHYFAATREMNLRKLVWVFTRFQVQVQRYCKW